jgi:hypothetical protein
MATIDDLFTAQKNGVVAINTLNQTWLLYNRRQHGDNTSKCLIAPTLITTGNGYIATVSVVKEGKSTGLIYNSGSTEQLPDDTRLVAIPKEIGVYRVDCQFGKGIVVVPGDEHAITITYTLD